MSYTIKSIADLTTELNANITDNTAKLNTAARVRTIVGDALTSAINRLDDAPLLNCRVFSATRPGGYAVGECMVYDPGTGYALYRCTTAHTGAFNAGHFSAINAIVGSAGGDLSGTYPNPTVVKINGVAYNADPLVQYVIAVGRAGGQIIKGGTIASQNLTLLSNSTGTPGSVLIESWATFSTDGFTITKNASIGSQAIDPLATLTVWQSDYENGGCGIFGNVISQINDGGTYSVFGYDYGVGIDWSNSANDSRAIGVKTAVNVNKKVANGIDIAEKGFIGFWADLGTIAGGAGTGTIADCIKYYTPSSTFLGTVPSSVYGHFIEDQMYAGVDQAYAIYIEAQSSYGFVSMADLNGIGIALPTEALHIANGGNILLDSRGQYLLFSGIGVDIVRPIATDTLQLTGADIALRQSNATTGVFAQVAKQFGVSKYDGTGTTFVVNPNTGLACFGNGTPVASAALAINSTTGAFLVSRMTTTQKNALTATNGMIVYDSTLNKFQGYENGAWASFI